VAVLGAFGQRDRGVAQDGAGVAAPQEAKEAPALPPGVYARIDGRDVTEKEYSEYLLASIGKRHLDEYIDRLLIEAAARSRGIVVTPEEVDALVEERIERTVRGIWGGDRDKFLAALAKRRTTLEEKRAQDRQEIYFNRLLEKLVLKSRELTPEVLRREFERAYGPGGVQYEIRHILVSTRKRTGPDGVTLPGRTDAEAKERAAKIRQSLLAGGDFAQLVKRYSDDSFTRPNDGRIPLYRADFYGAEFHAAVGGLTKEAPLSGVVRSRRGLHLIQLLDKRETEFDSVRKEVEERARNRPPTVDEERAFLRGLRAAAKIVR